MKHPFVGKSSITINAPASSVWGALTNPEMVKQYLFNTKVSSDWKVGSPITYTGEWEGKSYEDKGIILQFIPEKLLETTYLSGNSGLKDAPENYNTVSYKLEEKDGITTVTITQDNIASEESKKHSEKNWQTVLQGMKKLLEK